MNIQKFLTLESIDTQKDYDELNQIIKLLDKQYYDDDNPTVTDSDYDKLYFLLKQAQKQHSEFVTGDETNQQIAGHTKAGLNKVHHLYPELSLAKSKTIDEVQKYLDKWTIKQTDFDKPFVTDSFILQHKEDGLTIVLYFNHQLPNKDEMFVTDDGCFLAATRGNGTDGENVTQSIVEIIGKDVITRILKFLDGKLLVLRGEAIINDDDFEALNQDGQFNNSRNLVAGSIRTKNTKIAKQRHVRLLLYTVENNTDFNLQTEMDELKMMAKLFNDSGIVSCPLNVQGAEQLITLSKAEVVQAIQNFSDDKRDSINHTIDGLVIKPNNIANREVIGYTQHHPKNALAYKFASPDATTVLTDVKWQIGSNGTVTPVGIFEPVNILGATIGKASLATVGNIKRRDLKIGDRILVRRVNDVIPQIVKSFTEFRDGTEQEIVPPADTKLVGEILYSTKISEEQLLNQWKVFVSKQGLAIDGLSINTIKLLAENHLIDLNDFSSLFKIDHNKFVALDGLGETSWANLQQELDKAKTVTAEHLLVALNIQDVGIGFASSLIKVLNQKQLQLIDLIQFNDVQLTEFAKDLIDNYSGFGPHTEVILERLTTATVKQQVKNLLAVGIQAQQQPSADKLTGLKFVITGKTSVPRRQLKEQVEQLGGKVTGSVSSKTDYLVTNDTNSTSSKMKKAQSLNVPIINEEQLIQMIK